MQFVGANEYGTEGGVMAFLNHKRVVQDQPAKPTALCGAKDWISLISIDAHIDCPKCLKIIRKEEKKNEQQ